MRLLSMRLAAAAGLFAVLAGPGRSRADILFSQAWDGTGGSKASQNDTTGGNGNYATTYDNFTIGGGGSVTDVLWTGGYFGSAGPHNIAKFTIDFYNDNAGKPGSLITSYAFSNNGNETSLGGANNSYSGTLPTAFVAAAGPAYWMSIVPDLGYPPQWGWETSLAGDGTGYQDFFGTLSRVPNDFAFTLLGASAAVPEPSSLALGGLGLGVAAAYRGRRRSARAPA